MSGSDLGEGAVGAEIDRVDHDGLELRVTIEAEQPDGSF